MSKKSTLALAAALFMTGFAESPAVKAQNNEPTQQVRAIADPVRSRIEKVMGKIEPSEARLTTHPAGSTVFDVPVRAGDKVEAGQVLLVCDPEVAQYNVELAKQRLEMAKKNHATAVSALTIEKNLQRRMTDLVARHAASTEDVERASLAVFTAERICNSAESEVANATLALRFAETSLANMQPKSPVNGVVSDISRNLYTARTEVRVAPDGVGQRVSADFPLKEAPAVGDKLTVSGEQGNVTAIVSKVSGVANGANTLRVVADIADKEKGKPTFVLGQTVEVSKANSTR